MRKVISRLARCTFGNAELSQKEQTVVYWNLAKSINVADSARGVSGFFESDTVSETPEQGVDMMGRPDTGLNAAARGLEQTTQRMCRWVDRGRGPEVF
ncbi:hypothetical protein CYMTET_50218 [Cymbomonas tetramitiformis]|uniref:Uncharacterized protein n=1 Tax=Cymbomonas tetramitiformis TaxID=36881 RepID=A0AAE0BQ64_9CHLO|nr:hypothetical protein CYMTET_50218 [Cymbomonas tetramitiformis]